MAFSQSKLKDLDLSSVTGIGDAYISHKLDVAAQLIKAEWVELARRNLNTTSVDYINGIEVGEAVIDVQGNPKISIVLDGVVANMVEQGLGPSGIGSVGPFDMRTFILKNKQHANIPFHFVGIAAASGNTEVVAKTMQTIATGAVATRAMQLRGKKRLPRNLVPKIRNNPNVIFDPNTGEPHIQREHAVDPLAGLKAASKSKWGISWGVGQQVSKEFITFRRISWRGKPWIHPGIWPRHFAKQLHIARAFRDAFAED